MPTSPKTAKDVLNKFWGTRIEASSVEEELRLQKFYKSQRQFLDKKILDIMRAAVEAVLDVPIDPSERAKVLARKLRENVDNFFGEQFCACKINHGFYYGNCMSCNRKPAPSRHVCETTSPPTPRN